MGRGSRSNRYTEHKSWMLGGWCGDVGLPGGRGWRGDKSRGLCGAMANNTSVSVYAPLPYRLPCVWMANEMRHVRTAVGLLVGVAVGLCVGAGVGQKGQRVGSTRRQTLLRACGLLAP